MAKKPIKRKEPKRLKLTDRQKLIMIEDELRRAKQELASARLMVATHEATDVAGTLTAARAPNYGRPEVNFASTAHILNGVLGYKLKVPITPSDVGLLMIGVKLSRLSRSPAHKDSLDDILGYVRCHNAVLAADGGGTEHFTSVMEGHSVLAAAYEP